jgi:hypothetical protein
MEALLERIDSRFDAMGSRFDALETRFDGLEARFDGLETRFEGLHSEMRAGFNRIGVELDKRPTRSEQDARFASVDEKFDRVFTALDHATGKLHDNTQSHVVFGAMLGDHRRLLASHDERLTSLESRLPPRTP